MRTSRSTLATATTLVLLGCSGGSSGGDGGNPHNPPQVHLSPTTSQNIVDTQFSVSVSVSGCASVQQIEIFQQNMFTRPLKTAPGNPGANTFTLTGGDVSPIFGTLGIAPDMTLVAQAVCDDGRQNKSSPLGMKFFPVAQVRQPPTGQAIIMPDSFVAEGSGSNVTFIGCADTGNGLGLVRVDVNGNVKAVNNTLPFGCDYNAAITDLIGGTTRWLYEPGAGAFAFDTNLNITGGVMSMDFNCNGTSICPQFATGPNGDLVIYDPMQTNPGNVNYVPHDLGVGPLGAYGFVYEVGAIVNGQPVVEPAQNLVYIPIWDGQVGSLQGTIGVQKWTYNQAGPKVGQLNLLSQAYGLYDTPVIPMVAFSPNAETVYVPFQAATASGGSGTSQVLACPTAGSGTTGCQQRWKSPVLDGVVRYVIPYNEGTRIAAISDTKIWFLNDADGTVMNPGGVPATSSGQLSIVGVQPGAGPDFYVLAAGPQSYPTEIIAFDQAENGEVWRYSLDGFADTAQTALTIAIDTSGQSWLRVGASSVQPLTLTDYRHARGPTLPQQMP
jgi:hypothetical protein